MVVGNMAIMIIMYLYQFGTTDNVKNVAAVMANETKQQPFNKLSTRRFDFQDPFDTAKSQRSSLDRRVQVEIGELRGALAVVCDEISSSRREVNLRNHQMLRRVTEVTEGAKRSVMSTTRGMHERVEAVLAALESLAHEVEDVRRAHGGLRLQVHSKLKPRLPHHHINATTDHSIVERLQAEISGVEHRIGADIATVRAAIQEEALKREQLWYEVKAVNKRVGHIQDSVVKCEDRMALSGISGDNRKHTTEANFSEQDAAYDEVLTRVESKLFKRSANGIMSTTSSIVSSIGRLASILEGVRDELDRERGARIQAEKSIARMIELSLRSMAQVTQQEIMSCCLNTVGRFASKRHLLVASTLASAERRHRSCANVLIERTAQYEQNLNALGGRVLTNMQTVLSGNIKERDSRIATIMCSMADAKRQLGAYKVELIAKQLASETQTLAVFRMEVDRLRLRSNKFAVEAAVSDDAISATVQALKLELAATNAQLECAYACIREIAVEQKKQQSISEVRSVMRDLISSVNEIYCTSAVDAHFANRIADDANFKREIACKFALFEARFNDQDDSASHDRLIAATRHEANQDEFRGILEQINKSGRILQDVEARLEDQADSMKNAHSKLVARSESSTMIQSLIETVVERQRQTEVNNLNTSIDAIRSNIDSFCLCDNEQYDKLAKRISNAESVTSKHSGDWHAAVLGAIAAFQTSDLHVSAWPVSSALSGAVAHVRTVFPWRT